MSELLVPTRQSAAIEVSSTGSLGSELRSEERYYTNNPYAINGHNIERFVEDCVEHLAVPGQTAEATRSVVRTIMGRSALMAIDADYSELARHIEAAAPIPHTDDLLVYFAKNYGDRNPSPTIKADMAARLIEARNTAPSNRLILPAGFEAVRQWDNPEQLAYLWGETFGWTTEGCEAFLRDIAEQADRTPEERTTWFEGIQCNNTLVAATMAERLTMPGNEGPVELIELTEWAVHPRYRGHGLGRFAVRHSAQSVQNDLTDTPHLAFAEANLLSGAPHMARRAGLSIPLVGLPRHGSVPQIVFSNVSVGDGLEPAGEYRNFALVTA